VLSVVVLVAVAVAFYFASGTAASGEVLATVNGEPVYKEDIDATLALLPSAYDTPERRQSFLEQTIEQRLLTQEATRRGIEIPARTVAQRIETILNDTGRSPPELRLILAERNITPAQFESIVRDQLLVEQLGQEAVLSRVTVLEREIETYYAEHANEFLPPPGGARISHILVADEATAREVIARLNQGESFRKLAAEYSIDAANKQDGGSLGVLTLSDIAEAPFKNAALGLAENQYTKSPVKSSIGYHVLLRQLDMPALPTVRNEIHAKILREKQALAFASFLEGLRAGATIRLYTPDGVITVESPPPGSMEAFAACVGTKATLYVTPWSEASQAQLALFGSAQALLSVVDCDVTPMVCTDDNVQKFPLWEFDNTRKGQLSLEQISQESGCPLPK
jgi:foldase protein PrsA